jgi:hypothetical protein
VQRADMQPPPDERVRTHTPVWRVDLARGET